MRANMMPAFPAWQTQIPHLPPPTRLYHLAPIGVGTMQTESLTSYVARLADAHCVRVSTLVHREIGPGVLDHGAVRSLAQRNWTHYSHAINGTEATAQVLVDALQALTGRLELCFLTLLTWSQVVPPLGLLRRERAWCPTCYHEWREQGRPVYESVALGARRGDWLSVPWSRSLAALPGLPESATTLGRRDAARPLRPVRRVARGSTNTPATDLSVGVVGCSSTRRFDRATPAVRARPTKEQLIDAIEHCTAAPPGERRQDVAHAAHVSDSHLWAWRRGHTAPTLPLLLRLCASLGMTPLQLLAPGTAMADDRCPYRRPRTYRRGSRVGRAMATITLPFADTSLRWWVRIFTHLHRCDRLPKRWGIPKERFDASVPTYVHMSWRAGARTVTSRSWRTIRLSLSPCGRSCFRSMLTASLSQPNESGHFCRTVAASARRSPERRGRTLCENLTRTLKQDALPLEPIGQTHRPIMVSAAARLWC